MVEVKKKKQGKNITYVLYGELDMTSIEILEEIIDNDDYTSMKTVYFYLSNLDFIDSTGIGQLIKYYRKFLEREMDVKIKNDNPEIEEILELIGVRKVIEGA